MAVKIEGLILNLRVIYFMKQVCNDCLSWYCYLQAVVVYVFLFLSKLSLHYVYLVYISNLLQFFRKFSDSLNEVHVRCYRKYSNVDETIQPC